MTTVKEPPNGPKPPSFFRSVVSKLKLSVAPVSSGAQQPTPPPLKSQISDLPSPENVSRCEFTFSDGRQCSNPAKVYQQDELSPVKDKKVANQRASLCAYHSPKQKRGAKRPSDASALEALCSDLTTATNINRALAQTFLLMAQGRISRKDAVAFGYLSQLLLQSVSGVRAEYVAAHDYDPWQERLEESLAQNPDDDPDSSPDGDSGPHARNGVVGRQKAAFREKSTHRMSFSRSNESIRPLLPRKEGERRISPEVPQEQPHAERIMGEPDFADLYRRGRNLIEGKYDTTPEGRREANKLALDLELMKPAPEKPPRDFIGRVAHLQRTIRAGQERTAAGPEPSLPPEAFLSYDGHPINPPFATKVTQPLLAVPLQARPPNDPNRRRLLIRQLAARRPSLPQSVKRSDLPHLWRAIRLTL